jgi:hypothetical protein
MIFGFQAMQKKYCIYFKLQLINGAHGEQQSQVIKQKSDNSPLEYIVASVCCSKTFNLIIAFAAFDISQTKI